MRFPKYVILTLLAFVLMVVFIVPAEIDGGGARSAPIGHFYGILFLLVPPLAYFLMMYRATSKTSIRFIWVLSFLPILIRLLDQVDSFFLAGLQLIPSFFFVPLGWLLRWIGLGLYPHATVSWIWEILWSVGVAIVLSYLGRYFNSREKSESEEPKLS